MSQKSKTLNRLLPLVAIGTIADCQSILEPTNRMLVKAGLQIMNNNKTGLFGLEALLDLNNFSEKINSGYKITSQDLAYYFSPILNSSGRLSHAKLSIETLLAKNYNQGKSKAQELIQTNQSRKEYVKNIMGQIDNQVQAQLKNKPVLIWLQGDWSKGVVGLVASRIVSETSLPVIVVGLEENKATGSLRAPEGYNLPQAMKALSEDTFEKFGGHPGAAGFTTKPENLEEIKKGMEVALENQKEKFAGSRQKFIDFKTTIVPKEIEDKIYQKDLIWLESGDIDEIFLSLILSMDPFGQDFPMPKILFQTQDYSFKIIGKDQNHLSITINNIRCTAFNLSPEELEKVAEINLSQSFSPIWLIAKPSQNSWNGKTKLELIADEIFL
jgi:single-stranded-DNA-specific exonuclease